MILGKHVERHPHPPRPARYAILLNRANRTAVRRDVPLDAGGWQDAWAAVRVSFKKAGLNGDIYT